MSHLQENQYLLNAVLYFILKGAKLRIWLIAKIAHKDFLIGSIIFSFKEVEWSYPENDFAS